MAHLSILAEIMDQDLARAMLRLKPTGITNLDLKDHVFGRPIDHLDDETRSRLAQVVDATGTEIHCFSSMLGYWDLDLIDELEFRRRMSIGIDNLLRTATFVRPRMIRLLACAFADRGAWSNSNRYLDSRAPWVYAAYDDAIARIQRHGLQVTIENELHSLFSFPDEALEFFARLKTGAVAGSTGLTWDIQNMWQSGTYPSLDVYRALHPIINYVHVKGGQGTPAAPHVMEYRSLLAEAGWPVVDILSRVLADGVSPAICINTSHGEMPPGYEFEHLGQTVELARAEAIRDAAFLRTTFEEIT